MNPRVVWSGSVEGGSATVVGTRGLLLAVATDRCATTQTENIKNFEWPGTEVRRTRTVQMLSGSVIATQSFAAKSCACASVAFLAGMTCRCVSVTLEI